MFITGISRSYDDKNYDRERLNQYLSEDDYRYVIAALNLNM